MSAKSMFARLWDNFIAFTMKFAGSGVRVDDETEQYKTFKPEPIAKGFYDTAIPMKQAAKPLSSVAEYMLKNSPSNTGADEPYRRPCGRPG